MKKNTNGTKLSRGDFARAIWNGDISRVVDALYDSTYDPKTNKFEYCYSAATYCTLHQDNFILKAPAIFIAIAAKNPKMVEALLYRRLDNPVILNGQNKTVHQAIIESDFTITEKLNILTELSHSEKKRSLIKVMPPDIACNLFVQIICLDDELVSNDQKLLLVRSLISDGGIPAEYSTKFNVTVTLLDDEFTTHGVHRICPLTFSLAVGLPCFRNVFYAPFVQSKFLKIFEIILDSEPPPEHLLDALTLSAAYNVIDIFEELLERIATRFPDLRRLAVIRALSAASSNGSLTVLELFLNSDRSNLKYLDQLKDLDLEKRLKEFDSAVLYCVQKGAERELFMMTNVDRAVLGLVEHKFDVLKGILLAKAIKSGSTYIEAIKEIDAQMPGLIHGWYQGFRRIFDKFQVTKGGAMAL